MYRYDPDLEFLKDCSNDDVDVLVTYLTRDTDGSGRYTEELTSTDMYKKHSPNHKMYWDLVAAELQCYGGNTFATLFRGGKGVLYKEVLTDVCDRMKVNYNSNSPTEIIEMNLLMKIIIDSIEKMNSDEIEKAIKDLDLKTTDFSKESVIIAIQAIMKAGGFESYKIVLIVANAIAKALLGKGLSFATNSLITKALSVFIGPIGWVITGAWTLIDIGGPAYRVTIPSVIQIAYMRAKSKQEKINLEKIC